METTSTSLPPLHPPQEGHADENLGGTTTDKASQDGQGSTEEVFIDVSSKVTTIDKASPDDCGPTEAAKVQEKYQKLIQATLSDDWERAKKFLDVLGEETMTAKVVTVRHKSFTMLELAIMFGCDQVVEKLIKSTPSGKYDAEIFSSALRNAARGGRMKMVKALAVVVPESVDQALLDAITFAPKQREVIWYLVTRTKSAITLDTMRRLIVAGHLDILVYSTVRNHVMFEPSEDYQMELLKELILMKSYFLSGDRLNFWQKSILKCFPFCLDKTSFDNLKHKKIAQAPFIKNLGESHLRHKYSSKFADVALHLAKLRHTHSEMLELLLESGIIHAAAYHGITEIFHLCLKQFPELLLDESFTKKLMKIIVNGRHVDLFRLMNTIPYLTGDARTRDGLMKAIVESPRNEPADVSGAAFLMQRELQWFQVLENRSDPSAKSLKLREDQNEEENKTCWEGFVEKRQELLREARQWMKDTSSSCSLVATLITTVAFAAAFTVPGGNDSSTGIPIFLNKGSFIVFAIANALALFSSVTATLMFLAILTSRYAIEDFLHSLPKKMILGLTFLFLSLAFMLVAFGSALTIVLSERLTWIYIPITLLAAFPALLFAILQLPLYVEMVESTFWPRLYRPLKIW